MKEKRNTEIIRALTSEMLGKKYAIVNPEWTLMNEEEKKLYFQCLCLMLSEETSEITEEQKQYLLRLLKGAEMTDPLEAFLGMPGKLSEDAIQMLYPVLQKGKLRYYFLLEGILLAAMQNQNQLPYAFLAEVAQQMDISKADTEYICSVAMSILRQDEKTFPKAGRQMAEGLRECDFAPYVREYYVGLSADSDTLRHYYAPNVRTPIPFIYPRKFVGGKVFFENQRITQENLIYEHDWYFVGCEQVVFKNCKIYGKWSGSVLFKSCNNILLQNCEICDFTVPVFLEEENDCLRIENCIFRNCRMRTDDRQKVIGGVIYSSPSKKSRGSKWIIDTVFEKCGIWAGKSGYYTRPFRSYAIANGAFSVQNCSFFNCGYVYSAFGDIVKLDEDVKLFSPEAVDEGNKLHNCTKFQEIENEIHEGDIWSNRSGIGISKTGGGFFGWKS